MSEHLSGAQIEAWHDRRLAPAALLAIDDHLADCPECRMRLAAGERLAGALETWERLAGDGAEPLQGGLSPGFAAPPTPRRRSSRIVALLPLAAAIVGALGLGLFVGWQLGRSEVATLRLERDRLRKDEIATRREIDRLRRASRPRPATGSEPVEATETTELVAAVRDAGSIVGLDRAGRLRGLEA